LASKQKEFRSYFLSLTPRLLHLTKSMKLNTSSLLSGPRQRNNNNKQLNPISPPYVNNYPSLNIIINDILVTSTQFLREYQHAKELSSSPIL
jgi:hypothetical protein